MLAIEKEALDRPKEPTGIGLRYVAYYGGKKPVFVQVKGERIAEIYMRRGFVEIDRAEFNRLVQEMRASRGALSE
jgi:hypothetical protein